MVGVGSSGSDAIIASIPIATVNSLATLIPVCCLDKLGRRYFLLATLPGITVTMFGLGIAFYFLLF